jgi:predicted O-linked N-acetylglucosamine transferase (SPINDLY family)
MSEKVAKWIAQAKQLTSLGNHPEARTLLAKAVAKEPRNLEARFLLGNACGALGLHAEAEAAFREVLRMDPRLVGAYLNIGVAQRSQGRDAEAVESFRKALAGMPGNASVLESLVAVLNDLDRGAEAAGYAEQWLRLEPANALAHYFAAVIYQGLNDLDQAESRYLRALGLGGLSPHLRYSARLNLGVVYHSKCDYDQCLHWSRLALEDKPDCAAATFNIASAYLEKGDIAAAIRYCEKANTLQPDFAKSKSTRLFALNLLQPYDAAMVYEEHRRWGEEQRVLHAADEPPHFEQTAEPARRLRIGYVSDGFREHPVAFFLEPVLENHDSAQVEVFCYANVQYPDYVTARLQHKVDCWRDIHGVSEDEASALIRTDAIDILVDLDGHTDAGITLFARRNAPVQVSYLGYVNTTGLSSVDYLLTDRISEPDTFFDIETEPWETRQRFHSERLVSLGDTFFTYRPPDMCIQPAALPAAANGYVTFGSFNKAPKLNAQVLDLWAAVLRAAPDSRLLLQGRMFSTQHGKDKMVEQFAQRGVAGERLILLGWGTLADYLGAHNRVDLMLDPFPWNGHTNTCHALWMGVPTLTLAGSHHAGRFGAMIMGNVGHAEFVVDTPEQYVATASAMAQDLERLAQIRMGLRERLLNSVLCDHAALTRNIEVAYRGMWRRWCKDS